MCALDGLGFDTRGLSKKKHSKNRAIQGVVGKYRGPFRKNTEITLRKLHVVVSLDRGTPI